MSHIDPQSIATVVSGLDRWFDSMRVDWPTPGYGGPVVHWWNHCLAYTGAGLDWRYEGIIDGYLTLWARTGNDQWLQKAHRAGIDLVSGQRDDGHFANSRFELNPGHGGTPHEVACDVGLLLLSAAVGPDDPVQSEIYGSAAVRNLETFAFERLWHAPSSTFRDSRDGMSFVPNKAATFIEAVLLASARPGQADLVEQYAIPTGNHILAMQVRQSGEELDGAIAQNRFGDRIVTSYFPLYVARCVPALLQLSATTNDLRFRRGAMAAIAFLQRVQEADGSFPHVLYPRGRKNRSPRWVAGIGDVVRAFDCARSAGAEPDSSRAIDWILGGATSQGHIATATGFDKLVPWVSRRERNTGAIGVVGWCDKAFRALAHHADPPPAPASDHATSMHNAGRFGTVPGVVR